ncbi:MAG: prepilin peptidase [Planctomycetaceae bacterium]
MLLTGLLVAFLVVATITDLREHKIYNKTTYPGIAVGLIAQAWQGFLQNSWLGFWTGLQEGLFGFLVCGFIMLFCFVLFNVGGGDVKLLAMMGAFLGLEQGIEALLWTFVLGAVMGAAMLIWKFGLLNLLGNTFKHLRLIFRVRGWVPLTEEEREPLKRWLFLAPSALMAVLIMAAEREFHFLNRMFSA